jgi:hypothetical protein
VRVPTSDTSATRAIGPSVTSSCRKPASRDFRASTGQDNAHDLLSGAGILNRSDRF